jgi:predicted Zn-dependent protease
MMTMTQIERQIEMAQGYVELGMFEDARQTLDKLPRKHAKSFPVLEALVLCELGEHHWLAALDKSAELILQRPDDPAGYLHSAFCLHETGRTEEALEILKCGPRSLRQRSVYFYNMGCYNARLGETDTAMKMLTRAFEMDGSLRRVAKKDRDLDALRGLLT